MVKMTLNGGEPIDVDEAKVAVYESQGYALQADAPVEEETVTAVKRPAKKAAKKAAKKS